MKSATMIILYSWEIVESKRVMPDAPIARQRWLKFSVAAPTDIISMTIFANHGLAIARPLDAAIKKHELRNSFFMSSSSILKNKAFRISYTVALHHTQKHIHINLFNILEPYKVKLLTS